MSDNNYMTNQQAAEVLEKYFPAVPNADVRYAAAMGVEALKKQIPYKPQEYEDRYYACKCDNILLPKWKKYNTELMPKSEGLPHCMACGQKLDWS